MVLILFGAYWDDISNVIFKSPGKLLLNEPIYLNEETNLGSYENLNEHIKWLYNQPQREYDYCAMELLLKFKKKWGAQDFKYEYYTRLYDKNVLTLTSAELLQEFPHSFVLPFNELKS